jgi:putative endonuclease
MFWKNRQKQQNLDLVSPNDNYSTSIQKWCIRVLTSSKFQPVENIQPDRSQARQFSAWLGRRGERYASWWIRRHQGMITIDRNFRHGSHELDIIARDGQVIVFVEVRTLSSDHLQLPSASITPEKKIRLHSAAAAWRKQRGYRGLWRMDIIGIVWPEPLGEPSRIDHWVKIF